MPRRNLHLRTRTRLLAYAAILFTGAGLFWLFDSPAPEPGSVADRSEATPAVPTPLPSAASAPSALPVAAATTGPTGAPTAASQELLLRFNRSQSYRAFIHDALKHPEWGGTQWALTVLTICLRYPLDRANTAPAGPSTPSNEAQTAAKVALTTRCDLRKDENSELSSRWSKTLFDPIFDKIKALAFSHPKGDVSAQDVETSFKGADPHQNLLFAMMQPGLSNEAKATAIAQVLRTGDPFLVMHAIPSESSQLAGVNTYKTYFDGTWYTSEGNSNMLLLASDLATCNLGLDCSASSYKALSLCASRGFCGDSVADAIRNGVAQREGLQWPVIEALARKLTVAVQQGNAHAFIPSQQPSKP